MQLCLTTGGPCKRFVLPQVANAVVPDDQHIVVVEIVAVDEETKNSFGFRVLVALAGMGFLSFF